MASGAFEHPDPWLVEDTGLSSSSGLVVTTLGSMPLGQLLQHCGPTEAGGTLRNGGYVTPAMGVNLSHPGREWAL